MTIRLASRAAIVALALSAALGGTMLAPATASAKGWHGGFKHHGGHWGHGHWGHGHWGYGGWGYRRVGFYAAGYPADYGGCVVRRFIDVDGDLVVRRRCY